MKRFFILYLCLGMVGACNGTVSTPEEELRAWVALGESSAEEKDRSALLAMISPDYADARGNDKKKIGDLLRLYFFRQQTIGLLTRIENITVEGGTAAVVDLTVGMAGTDGRPLGLSADAYRFVFELEKSDDEWLLIGGRWASIGDLPR